MPQSNNHRTFGLTNLAVDNSTSVIILALMILFFGILAYRAVPKEQFPEVDFPAVYVNTPYFGNSAEDIENLVTRPIEQELQSVDGVKNIKSTSIQDFSVITIEFQSGEDIDEAVRKVKDAVDKAKTELPNDLDQEPTVLDINLSELPIVTINLSGDFPNDALRNYAEFLQDEIESISEVSSAELKGAREREMKVEVDLKKMESLQISFTDIENAIRSENITMSGGELVANDFRRAIRVKGEYESVADLEKTIVKSENQRPIYLRDIAAISFSFQDPTSIARSDGFPVVSLDVIKRQGENLLSASDKIKEAVEGARSQLPPDLKISLFNDQSVNTRNQVSNLENSIISGVILVVLVLLFFLGLRNALFVGIAIPLSMLMGILFISLAGVTLNIVVLFALILALGLLVDNGIVVVENIYRYMQEGYSQKDAAKYGAGEVALPIIASTATTLAAFLPMAFWPGIVGSFMQYLPITLIIVLTSSLFVALVINPVLTSRFMKVDEQAGTVDLRKRKRRNVIFSVIGMAVTGLIGLAVGQNWLFNLAIIAIAVTLFNFFVLRPASFRFQNNALPKLENAYDRFIRWALRHSLLIFGGTFVLLFLSVALLGIRQPKVEFFPSADPIYVNVFVELPLGSDITATNRTTRRLEERIMNTVDKYATVVEAVLTQIGENTADPNAEPEPGVTPHRARITVTFVPTQERGDISTGQIMEEIRQSVRGIPGVAITVDQNANGPATGKPINLEVQGENIDQLVQLSDDLISYINDQNIPGIEELQADIKLGKPELQVNVDREAAGRYGVSTFAIAEGIRTAVFGKEVSTYKQGEDEFPINVRLDDAYRYNVDDILNQRITFRSPATGRIQQVPISAIADVEYSSTYNAIKRKDLDRVLTIYSNVLDGYFPNEIIPEIDAALERFAFPSGVSYEFTGEQQQQAEDLGFLSLAFLAAVFLIFIILVAQFNSISAPFIIILSVLFSTIGVLLGYVIFGNTVSVIFTGVGVISLAGVVVNNAIVLIDYIKILLARAMKKVGVDSMYELNREDIKTSVIQGGATRLRPVLLTAITTVLGLVPLAIGFNFNFFTLVSSWDPNIFIGGDNTALWGPMAWTVIYGLTFATFLTLVVVPVMFYLSYRMNVAIRRLLGSDKTPAQKVASDPSIL